MLTTQCGGCEAQSHALTKLALLKLDDLCHTSRMESGGGLSAFPPQFVAGVTAPLAGGYSQMGSIEVLEGHLINLEYQKADLFGDVYIHTSPRKRP